MKCNRKSNDDGFPAKFYANTEKNAFMKSAKFHPIEKAHEREVYLFCVIITHSALRSEIVKRLIECK